MLYRIGASIRTFQKLHIVIRTVIHLLMKQKKKNLREKVNEKERLHLLKYMGALLLDRVFFVLVCKKNNKKKNYRK